MNRSDWAIGGGRVYVDEAVVPLRSQRMAHMFSLDLEALHRMAERLGVRDWFQNPLTMPVRWPHYDLSAAMRDRAIKLGAVPVNRYQAVVMAAYLMGEPQPQTEFAPMVEALAWLRSEVEAVAHGGRFTGLVGITFAGDG